MESPPAKDQRPNHAANMYDLRTVAVCTHCLWTRRWCKHDVMVNDGRIVDNSAGTFATRPNRTQCGCRGVRCHGDGTRTCGWQT